jgi:hypothetical protein
MRALKISVVAVVAAALLVALPISAGAGSPGASVAKKKKKKCPAGTQRVVVKKKGKKKKKCVPLPAGPANPAAPTASLAISPGGFVYPMINHGACNGTPGDADCTFKTFTVTNSGGAASGPLAVSLVEITQPVMGVHSPGFAIGTNTCTGALPPGGSCSVSAVFLAPSNAGDGHYVSQLVVSGSPGGSPQATLDGTTSD